MADAAMSILDVIFSGQGYLLGLVNLLNLTAYLYPPSTTLINGSSFDYIVIGGGTAGSILANRLLANNASVLLIEEGSYYAPLESDLPELFTLLPNSTYDRNICSVNDGKTAQNLQNSCIGLTLGKLLGGGAAIDHMIHVRGHCEDYNNWARILNDDRWNCENSKPFFEKAEGMIKTRREPNDQNEKLMKAFVELEYNVVNNSTESILGFSQPLFTIHNGIRQTTANTYLNVKKYKLPQLTVSLSTTAEKILIEKDKAVGVQIKTSNGEIFKIYANKEVIVSAGAIGSPKLLMLSGIGPKSDLEKLGIPVVKDLPVGENFMDHPSMLIPIQLEANNDVASAVDPYQFPVPCIQGFVALDKSQTYPDYQDILLFFPHDSPAMLQLCSNVFKYSNDVCNKYAEANKGRSFLLVVHNIMLPKSRGKVVLKSSDPNDNPLVYTKTYSNPEDLNLMARSAEHFIKVLDTEEFKSRNATLVDPGFCPRSSDTEYWPCRVLAESAGMWHYSGTCAMGTVVDTELRVKGIPNLRVIDASVMPELVSGNIRAAVTMIAEKGAAFITGNV